MYTKPVEVAIGEHQPHYKGGGTYRHVTFHFPNGAEAHASCVMTEDGRAELRVGTNDEGVTIFAFDKKCEPPPV
jgi:hypothetical protein